MKFLLVASLAESLVNFRWHLIRDLQDQGLEVHVAAPNLTGSGITRDKLEGVGVLIHDLPMRRNGTNPLFDAMLIYNLWRLMIFIKPDYFLGYTIKPVIYGALAAWFSSVPHRFALITGLGYTFQGDCKRFSIRWFVQLLYKIALKKVEKVFFQNPDDENLFRTSDILSESTPSVVINGSGIDLDAFSVVPLPSKAPVFVLIARLLGSKGVREYAEVAQNVRLKYPEVSFHLVGWIDEGPDAIKPIEIDAWERSGCIKYLGRLFDVRPAIAGSSVYVFPSYYREGTPRTVLEAMAMGRAVITTDAPGCRETVVDGLNGFLVPVQCVEALEKAVIKFIADPLLSEKMGMHSRLIAEDKYDVRKVNNFMLQEMGIK